MNIYITTPVYHTDPIPSFEDVYAAVLGDILCRIHNLFGEKAYFLNQKGYRKNLNIDCDNIISINPAQSKTIVNNILLELFKSGIICKKEQKKLYCPICKHYFSEHDVKDNLCPDCRHPVIEKTEPGYFIKLNDRRQWLIEYIRSHPDFINPASRVNEILKLLEFELKDLCIARAISDSDWTIELPFDSDFVCNPKFYALLTAVADLGYGSNNELFLPRWQNSCFLVENENLFAYAVHLPIILNRAGLTPPKTILVLGQWLVSEHIDIAPGKTITAITELLHDGKIGVDAFRYFLAAEKNISSAAALSLDSCINRYNTSLSNDLGNLLNRVVKLTESEFDSKIPYPPKMEKEDRELVKKTVERVITIKSYLKTFQLEKAIFEIQNIVRAANRYMEETKPWVLVKSGSRERLATVIYVSIETLRNIGGTLLPFMPEKMSLLLKSLGVNEKVLFDDLIKYGISNPETPIKDPGFLFPKYVPADFSVRENF